MKYYFYSYVFITTEQPFRTQFDSGVTATHPFIALQDLCQEGYKCTLLSFQEITAEEFDLYKTQEINDIL